MKKSLLALALASLSVLGLDAQTSTESGLGIRVSWDYSVPATNLVGLDSGSGVSVGAIYDIPLYQGLYYEPGLSVFYDTMDLNFFDFADLYLNGRNLGIDGTMRNFGFRIPMIFGYRFDLVDGIAVSVIAGPQLNVGLVNKIHYKNGDGPDHNLYDSDWHHNDLQLVFGMKFHYLDNFFAELTGGLGVTNMLDGNSYRGSHVRRNLVSLGVGYKF